MVYNHRIFVWMFFVYCTNHVYSYLPYKDQAKLFSENGHLYIVSAEGANITLRTRGAGYININEENLLQATYLARKAALSVEKFESESLVDIQTTINGLTSTVRGPMLRRLERLETFLPNSTSGTFTTANVLFIRRKIILLTRRINMLLTHIRLVRRKLITDDCASNPCENGGTCIDLYNGFHCICPQLWEGLTCQKDVDECDRFNGTDLGCQNGGTCQNTEGGYNCLCPDNWFGLHCTRRTYDCTAQDSAEICGHGVCINRGGAGRGFICICDQGWTSTPGTGSCTVDINECDQKAHPCSHDPPVSCVNLPGSFDCEGCPPGYSGNGYHCADIDECLINNGGCSSQPQVQCINTRGSFSCGPCPPGYSGNGITCEPVSSLCVVNNGGCNDMATCIHNPSLNYVQCRCPLGWTGSGIGPSGCVQLANVSVAAPCKNNPCLNGGICNEFPDGRFACTCLPIYRGPTCAEKLDVCQPNPCKNGATCVEFSTNIRCYCSPGFTGFLCENEEMGCVGRFTGLEGTLKWPRENSSISSRTSQGQSCNWVITSSNSSLVIKIQFTKINVPSRIHNCAFQYIEIFNGRTSSYPSFGRFCGTSLPEPIISTHPSILIVLQSYLSSNGEFTLTWTAVKPECGGNINASVHGILTSPGSPGPYPHNADCEWHLIAPEGKRIQISFFSLDIEIHANCSSDFLEILDGPSLISPLLKKLCNKTQPAPILTSSNAATIHFHSDNTGSGKGFQITYTPTEGIPGCGGTFTAPTGRITPPSSITEKNSYADHLNCEWKIQIPEGERIKLSIVKLSLESSNNCKYDSLAVYDGPSVESDLFGKWCGNVLPLPVVSTTNILTILFISDHTFNEGEFVITYISVCGGNYYESSGVLSSPYYPKHYPEDRQCTYLIQQPPGKAIELRFLDVDIEEEVDDECEYDYLMIYDGDSDASPLRGEFCGNGTPGVIISSHNYLYLVFNTDDSRTGRGFYANYSTFDVGCGGILVENTGFISSPKYPDEYPVNKSCHWIIKARPGYIIQLTWLAFKIEFSPSCVHDWVKIYDNTTTPLADYQTGESYCGSNMPPVITSSSNLLLIEFHTDSSEAEPGFMATYTTLDYRTTCSGNFFGNVGSIKSPNYPDNYPDNLNCVWVITVPNGKMIHLNVIEFDIEKFSMKCEDDFLEIRNGGYESSPLINRYCGTTIDREITSMTNQMYIKFISDSSYTSKGFFLTWDSSLTGCGGTLFGSFGDIISPNYPLPYGKNADCTWRISVSHGSVIKLMILDMELEAEDNCYLDFLEIRDGAYKGGRLLGRYCKGHMTAIHSSSNHLYLRFRSDISAEGRGFHLRYVTDCNRTITGFRGVIESPNFPNDEPDEVNCNWIIEAPKGNSINISFSHFKLVDHPVSVFLESSFRMSPFSRFSEAVVSLQPNKSCSHTYLQIYEGSGTNLPSIMNGMYCGTIIPSMYSSTLDHLYIKYKSSRFSLKNTFRLEWIVSGCGGHLKKPFDTLESPGYPNGYTRAYVCEWYITVEYGKSIDLRITDLQLEKSPNCTYDSLKVFGGADDKAPLLISRCDKSSDPIIVQTSGNKAYIRFESDTTYHGRGFRAYYILTDSKCGGKFVSTHGRIHSSNYPQNYGAFDDCSFLISVDSTMRIVLNFTDFDIFSISENDCDSSYVAVYDGDSLDAPELGKFCGNRNPKAIQSSSNQLFVRHKADGENVAKGFIAEYHQACGATITTDSSGVIDFSEAYSELFNNDVDNCSWVIRSDKLDSKITLSFLLMDVGNRNNESVNGVSIYAGEDTTSPRLGTYNGQWSPPPIVVPSSAVTILYIKSHEEFVGRFSVEYSVLDTACGGRFMSESGTIVSPNYPDNYPSNSECVWTLLTSPGNRVMLEIVELNIQVSESCNSDYLEVREKDSDGKLMGVYCESNIPDRLYSNKNMWIKFRSSEGGAKGFKAHYSLVHGGELSGISGQLASPLYPKNYIKYGKFNWRITVQPSHAIRIAVIDLFIEKMDEVFECVGEIMVYDGYDSSARILKRICGIQIPEPFTSGSNVVYIEFLNFINAVGSKFLIDWMQVPKETGSSSKNQSVSILDGILCRTKVELSIDPVKNNSYTFSSPGFPEGYKTDLNCEWIIESEPQNHIEILFNKLDLESNRLCLSDYVALYKASLDNVNTWDKIAQVCHENDTLSRFSGNNIVKVVFRTDFLSNKTGFEAKALTVCGGSMSGPNGIIKSPPVYVRGTCQWNVTVKPGQTIKLKFNKLKLTKDTEGTSCGYQYLMLRDGGTSDSPYLGAGKYCGEDLKDIPNTHSNKLFILFQSTHWMVQQHYAEFELEYEAHSISCGGNIVLSKNIQSAIIHSPNYPNVPPAHIQCIWTIIAPAGETIHFNILGRFDITYSVGCEKEYLELREGNTEIGHLIGRFCNISPNYLITEGNSLYVKYFTDVNDPRDGFKANISLAKCGGNVFTYLTYEISSPGYPESYDGNLTCIWRLTTDDRLHFKLHFHKFNLGGTALKHYKDPCDENIEDTLTITDVYRDNYSINNSKVFCGQNDSLEWESDSNIVQIKFKSLQPRFSSDRKFLITFTSAITRASCSESLNAPEGEIQSPGYPYSRKKVHCIWKINVPKGKRVTFTVTDLDMETNLLSNITRLGPQIITFYNDKSFRTRIATWHGYKEPGTFIESTSNFMVVTYFLRNINNHRGFSAKYSSHNPAMCGGDLTDTNGTVYLTEMFLTEVSIFCQWEYINKLNTQSTFSLLITANVSSGINIHEDCSFAKHSIVVRDGSRTNLVGEFCSRTETNKPYIISSPHPVVVIDAMRTSKLGTSYDYVEFKFIYKVNQCGGVLDSKAEYFVSPQYPQPYASNLDCVWLVTFDEESIIKVSFNSFDLETDCDNDYLAIYNGDSARAPLIGKYCGNIPLPDIISNSNKLWFSFHSNEQLQSKGFNISLTPLQEGCGGILHGDGGEIISLNYPSAYINDLECDWEIRVDTGFHIGLIFSGRFFIEQSVNCTNDYLEVSDYVDNDWKSLGRVCGRETTKIFNSTTNRMRLFFKTNDKIIGDGFKAIWNINCGSVIKTNKSGYLYSPGYPQNYKGSLDCKYEIDLSTTKVITGQFEYFDLEEATSRGCIYDKVIIYTKSSGRMYRVLGTYCGNSPPPEFYSRGRFKIHLITDNWTSHNGFVLRYSIPECGGNIVEETEIVSPTYRPKGYFSPLDCVWNITAPEDKIITFRIISRIPVSRRCRHAGIQLWDGSIPIRGNNSNLIATLCGEIVKQPGQFRTKGNQAVFEFRSNNFQRGQKFSAIISFTYGEAAGCGGNIELSTPTYVRSPDKINNNSLDCHWYIETSEGNSINLQFENFQVENCTRSNISCSCDFVEVYDGQSMNSEVIGKYCGNVLPGTVLSSHRFISFKFVSDGNGKNSQFVILATPTPSLCGKSVINVNSTPQELTSPNYPDNYPTNVHCKWVLHKQLWATFDLHIVDVDIEPSDTCSNDRLQIRELERGYSHFLLWGANPNEKLIIGLDRTFNYRSTVGLLSSVPSDKSIFCGKGQTMDYYSESNRIQISFVSDSQTTAKGFKIRYSIANCSRNYTASQGRILQSRLTEDCTIFIKSANPNDTISLYFNVISISFRQNCSVSSLKIYDEKNSTSSPVATICGFKVPNPIFSTGPEVKLKYESKERRITSFDLTYTATDQGRGCGGRFFNDVGVFTSPFYPSNQRKSTSCRWDITVPVGNVVVIEFQEFDLGPASTCGTDFVTIYEHDAISETDKFRVRYCGPEKPAIFEAKTNSASVVYKTSLHNGGTGWLARFMSKGPGHSRLIAQGMYGP
ncbi:cubilin-like isoform X1 [Rhodnius prolixus]|uniref:cubilin-like isoform X1 n=2 Tax=Rhodnius prolixus TaxID=13249 RepID=UPI003D18E487